MIALKRALCRGEKAIRQLSKATTVLLLIGSLIPGIWIDGARAAEPSPAEIDRGGHPTNLRLLKRTAEEAIEEVCDRLSSHGLSTICLEPPSELDGRWLIDQILTERLLAEGYRVVLSDSLSAQEKEIRSGAGFLGYRIVRMHLDYISSRRKHLFGPRLVQREVRLNLFFRLSRAAGEIIWAGEINTTGGDWVPMRELPRVERESPAFLSPRLEPDGWGRLAEPALLTAAVGGLIYLFYSTQ
jgi:hypothetical protein